MKTEGQKASKRQEERIAETFGGQRVAASGAFWSRKGDVRGDRLQWECKWTGKTQFSLRQDILRKLFVEAVLVGRIPALALSFNDSDNYVVLTEDDFYDLWQAAGGNPP